MNTEKTLIYVDNSKISDRLNELQSKASYLNSFTDEFLKLDIGTIESEELTLLFTNPKEYVANKILGDNNSLGDLPLDKSKLYEIVEKPLGVDAFITRIEKHLADRSMREGINLSDFFFKANRVEIKPEKEANIKEFYSVYLINKKQHEVHKALLDIVEGLNTLQGCLGGYLDTDNLKTYLSRVAVPGEVNSNRWSFKINYEGFRKIK